MLGKGFKYSAGDYETIEVRSLSFEEFLNTFNLLDLFNLGENDNQNNKAQSNK